MVWVVHKSLGWCKNHPRIVLKFPFKFSLPCRVIIHHLTEMSPHHNYGWANTCDDTDQYKCINYFNQALSFAHYLYIFFTVFLLLKHSLATRRTNQRRWRWRYWNGEMVKWWGGIVYVESRLTIKDLGPMNGLLFYYSITLKRWGVEGHWL